MTYNESQYNLVKFSEDVSCNCDFCLKEFQKNKKQLYLSLRRGQHNLFCSKECAANSSKNMTKNLCRGCGKETKYPNVFCSSSCSARFNNQVKKVTLTCKKCEQSFNVLPHIAKNKQKNENVFCSKRCSSSFYKILNRPTNKDILKAYPKAKRICSKKEALLIELECEQCRRLFKRSPRINHNKNKSGKMFCTRSCRMKYFNIHHHINKGCSRNVSFPEDFLFERLSNIFPNCQIIRNDRQTLKCGLEIDLYFPELKLGIEINGPVHYMPIYGEDKLERTKFKDSTKYQEMHSQGISFLIIDVSFNANKKKMSEYLLRQLEDCIIPIIQTK